MAREISIHVIAQDILRAEFGHVLRWYCGESSLC